MIWIDSHCHLNALEFASNGEKLRETARNLGVACAVIPAVQTADFFMTRTLAYRLKDCYALGVHPLYTNVKEQSVSEQLDKVQTALTLYQNDLRLVAVGEIGLDYFAPDLDNERQMTFFRGQLHLAKTFNLPVILHARKSVDQIIANLRSVGKDHNWLGIVHAFNGSDQQAKILIQMGFKLGFGGALTFERATQLRHLASTLPLESLVLETDAPDMPPSWIYQTAAERSLGAKQGQNHCIELPKIAAALADLRGLSLEDLSSALFENTCNALPKMRFLFN